MRSSLPIRPLSVRLFRPALATALILLGSAAFATATAHADPQVGKMAPDFTLSDIGGQSHSLSDYRGKIVVLEWTNPECPIVGKHYNSGNMPRLQKEAEAKGVVWLSINSGHSGAQGDFDKSAVDAWLKEKGASPTAYFRDTDGRVGHLYGAKATPNMFVVSTDGTLVYAGAIDSIPSANQADIAHANNYVRAALDALIAGQPIPTATSHPYGCSVKY